MLHALPILQIHQFQNFSYHSIRKLLQDVSNIVRFQSFSNRGDFFGIHLAQELTSDFVAEKGQYFSLPINFYEPP